MLDSESKHSFNRFFGEASIHSHLGHSTRPYEPETKVSVRDPPNDSESGGCSVL
jgi:hypothetical protein